MKGLSGDALNAHTNVFWAGLDGRVWRGDYPKFRTGTVSVVF
jgi:hypothetical protein